MYDLLIRNAQLLDGTGQPAYKADIAIEQGRIAAEQDDDRQGSPEGH